MNQKSLVQNIIDQVKEAQLKLGYVRETIRLYYPVSSLNALLETDCSNEYKTLERLRECFGEPDDALGKLDFQIHGGRIVISVLPEGAEYVWQEVPDPAFLVDIIALFKEYHNCSLEQICGIFKKYSADYVCEKMPDGSDFDYAFHFINSEVDPYYYCIRMEMGHTIYHRFSKADYELMFCEKSNREK